MQTDDLFLQSKYALWKHRYIYVFIYLFIFLHWRRSDSYFYSPWEISQKWGKQQLSTIDRNEWMNEYTNGDICIMWNLPEFTVYIVIIQIQITSYTRNIALIFHNDK